jgi:hypothetical protein
MTSKPYAHRKPVAERAYERATRPCLCCLRPFASEWVGHRLCHACKLLHDLLPWTLRAAP